MEFSPSLPPSPPNSTYYFKIYTYLYGLPIMAVGVQTSRNNKGVPFTPIFVYLGGFYFVSIAIVRYTVIMYQSKIYGYLYEFPYNATAGLRHVRIKQGYHSHPFVFICVAFILCLLQLRYMTIVDQFKIYMEFYIGEF